MCQTYEKHSSPKPHICRLTPLLIHLAEPPPVAAPPAPMTMMRPNLVLTIITSSHGMTHEVKRSGNTDGLLEVCESLFHLLQHTNFF